MTTGVEVEVTQEQADVKRGAAVMDALCPGWEHQINESELMMADPRNCAAAQILGHYDLLEEKFSWDESACMSYGFNVRRADTRVRDSGSESYAHLEQAWIDEAKARL